MHLVQDLDANAYDRLRDGLRESDEKASELAKLLGLGKGKEVCDCDAAIKPAISGLPVEQLKGVAIGARMATEMLMAMIINGGLTPVSVCHHLSHITRSAIELVGTDDEFNDFDIPL